MIEFEVKLLLMSICSFKPDKLTGSTYNIMKIDDLMEGNCTAWKVSDNLTGDTMDTYYLQLNF